MFSVKPRGVCARHLQFSLSKDDCVQQVHFVGGCNGNLQGIARLVEGMPIETVVERLEGICCGDKSTSCPDQLAKGLRAILLDREQNL